MDLTIEEKQVIVNVLEQISLPIKQAPTVLQIVEKLKFQITKDLESPKIPSIQKE